MGIFFNEERRNENPFRYICYYYPISQKAHHIYDVPFVKYNIVINANSY